MANFDHFAKGKGIGLDMSVITIVIYIYMVFNSKFQIISMQFDFGQN